MQALLEAAVASAAPSTDLLTQLVENTQALIALQQQAARDMRTILPMHISHAVQKATA